jgi:hypothetical protein
MRNLIDNLINGNLSFALQLAERHSWDGIFKFLRDEQGCSEQHARTCTDYLKGKGSFQRYCDAVNKDV